MLLDDIKLVNNEQIIRKFLLPHPQKTSKSGFLRFSGGIETKRWFKKG